MMDCPICLDAITPSTGVVQTSCGHSFHFSCISTWYAKNKSNCPCCRAPAAPTEALPAVKPQEEEEEEFEFFPNQLDAFLRERGGNGLTETIAMNVCPEVASLTQHELQMLIIGNGGRPINSEFGWFRALLDTRPVQPLEITNWEEVINPEEA